jgi:hypothetical protein
MIRLDSADKPMNRAWLESAGGFAWWYAEILDEEGNGLVLIWSFGLPFLPGYLSAARRGLAELPKARPSLNLAVYQRGEPAFYVLHEFRPEDVSWDGASHWRFGETWIDVEEEEDGTQHLDVHLDCPLRGTQERATGRIRLAGPLVRLSEGAAGLSLGQSEHCWTPVAAPAFGTALLQLDGGRRVQVAGRAYHDRNGSAHGLHDLGIGLWVWGHVSLPEGERIFYLLWPEGQAEPEVAGFTIDRRGQIAPLTGLAHRLEGASTTFYGMPSWERIALTLEGAPWLSLRPLHTVDSGPFYVRALAEVEAGGVTRMGSMEVIDPARIDLDRHRFLVRMRVASDRQANSIWLPLFQGSREGRVARLFQSLTRARPADQRQEEL